MRRQGHQGWTWMQGRSEVPRSGSSPREARSFRSRPSRFRGSRGRSAASGIGTGEPPAHPRPSPQWLCCTVRVAVGGKALRLRRMSQHGCVHTNQTSTRFASATPCVAQSMGADPGRRPGTARSRRGAVRPESGPARSRPVPSGVFHVKRRSCRRPRADLSVGREGAPFEIMTGTWVGPGTSIRATVVMGRISRCYPVGPPHRELRRGRSWHRRVSRSPVPPEWAENEPRGVGRKRTAPPFHVKQRRRSARRRRDQCRTCALTRER